MPNLADTEKLIEESLDAVEHWVEARHYRGYEPFDGLSSWFRPLTFGNLLGERLLLQLIRQSPVNLRPLMGVKPKDSTKGRGYMASGYLARYRTTGQLDYLRRAESCLDWLDQHKVGRFVNHSWSNHFDFSSRGGSYTSEDPIIVWTALIGFAYLDAYEQTGNARWLEIADSACRWIMDLPAREDDARRLHQLPGGYPELNPQFQHAWRSHARPDGQTYRQFAHTSRWPGLAWNTVAAASGRTAPGGTRKTRSITGSIIFTPVTTSTA